MVSLSFVAEAFGNKLKPHDKRNFESCRLRDLQRDIATIQSQRVQTRTMMNMTRLGMFLEATEQLGKMFAVMQTNGREQAMSLLWGSIRYILKVDLASL